MLGKRWIGFSEDDAKKTAAERRKYQAAKPHPCCQRVEDNVFHLCVEGGSTSLKTVRGDRRRRAEPACARSFSRVYGDQDQDDSRAWAIRAIRVIRGAKEFQEISKKALTPFCALRLKSALLPRTTRENKKSTKISKKVLTFFGGPD